MPGLIAELQRRNVFRVALLYLISSWVALQVVDVGVSLLGLPGWTGRLVVLQPTSVVSMYWVKVACRLEGRHAGTQKWRIAKVTVGRVSTSAECCLG